MYLLFKRTGDGEVQNLYKLIIICRDLNSDGWIISRKVAQK